MANQRLTDRTALSATPADGDLLHIVDVSDTTDNASGTSKKITAATLLSGVDADATQTLTNKTIDANNNTISNLALGAEVTGASTDLTDTADITYNADTDVSANGWVIDEDNMASDLATKVPTQQSVKAYVDANAGGASQLSDLSDVGVTTATNRNALMADGDSWESRAIVEADISDLGSYITASSADTLTNKTIDGDNNTISNLDIGNEVDWAAATDVSDRTAFASGDKLLIFEDGVGLRKIDYDDLPGAGGGLANIVEDTTPQLGGMLDVNGNAIGDGTLELLKFSETVSAVNEITVTNAATGNAPSFSATGDDTNIDLNLVGKGTGVVQSGGVEVATISGTQTLTNKTIDAANNTVSLTTDSVDAITEIASALKTGSDTTLVTGTAGTSGNLAQWDGNGDAVDSSIAASAVITSSDTASTSASGIVELATAAETTTGTDATRAVTPDGLAGSDFGIRYMQAIVFDFATDTATGDGKFYMHVPAAMGGMNLVEVHAEVITAGTTGTTDIQIHNVTQAADMLSTKLTIDSAETGSDTAATAAVIDTANDDVAENDLLRIDVDAVSTTAAKGLIVTLGFQLP